MNIPTLAFAALAALALGGCHVCADEIQAIAMMLPCIPLCICWLRAAWRTRQ